MPTKKATREERDFELFQDWLSRRWRPLMAFVYMFICLFDFVLGPILWAAAQATQGIHLTAEWIPLTLQGGGLFHVSMGAILGVAAWGRSQEKLAALNGSPTGKE